jgi:ATP10 protein
MSPHALFKADRAKYSPNFVGQTISLENKQFDLVEFASTKKATLIAIFSTQMAYRMCKPYLDAVENTYPLHPSLGVVRVQFEENWAKMALIKYYLKSRYLRPRYTPEQQVYPLTPLLTRIHIF